MSDVCFSPAHTFSSISDARHDLCGRGLCADLSSMWYAVYTVWNYTQQMFKARLEYLHGADGCSSLSAQQVGNGFILAKTNLAAFHSPHTHTHIHINHEPIPP